MCAVSYVYLHESSVLPPLSNSIRRKIRYICVCVCYDNAIRDCEKAKTTKCFSATYTIYNNIIMHGVRGYDFYVPATTYAKCARLLRSRPMNMRHLSVVQYRTPYYTGPVNVKDAITKNFSKLTLFRILYCLAGYFPSMLRDWNAVKYYRIPRIK